MDVSRPVKSSGSESCVERGLCAVAPGTSVSSFLPPSSAGGISPYDQKDRDREAGWIPGKRIKKYCCPAVTGKELQGWT